MEYLFIPQVVFLLLTFCRVRFRFAAMEAARLAREATIDLTERMSAGGITTGREAFGPLFRRRADGTLWWRRQLKTRAYEQGVEQHADGRPSTVIKELQPYQSLWTPAGAGNNATEAMLVAVDAAIQRATQKTTKVRLGTLSNRALCKDRAKTSSLGSQGLVLEGSGALLGWLLAVLGRLLGLLGRFLGGMWPLLGHSWASLGWSGSLPVCILAPLDAPGRDFFGFGALLGWVLEGFGGMLWHALCCPSRFIT